MHVKPLHPPTTMCTTWRCDPSWPHPVTIPPLQDKAASDSMSEAITLMGLSGLMRQAIKLIKGIKITHDDTSFSMAVFSVFTWFKVGRDALVRVNLLLQTTTAAWCRQWRPNQAPLPLPFVAPVMQQCVALSKQKK